MDLGNFKILRVQDGDTFQVDTPPMPDLTNRTTLRLHHIDTEETHMPKDLGPVTKYGHEVKKLAEEWFAKRGNEVVLKTDGANIETGFYDRPLVQVFSRGDHYQEHAIAVGWTPYYCKYGYSETYHESFRKAEEKARRDRLGIWSPELQSRPFHEGRPYDLLLQWWQLRAAEIEKARKSGSKILMLSNAKDYKEAFRKARNQEEAVIFGEITRPEKSVQAGTGLFEISVKMNVPFHVYVPQTANRSKIIEYIEKTFIANLANLPSSLLKPGYIFLKGQLSIFSRYGHEIPQMIVTDLKQILENPVM